MKPDTRYFYTDPLAACWMAKHFGMACFCEFTEKERIAFEIPATEQGFPFGYCGFCDPCSIERWGEVIAASKNFRKIYVRADSLHLLEPHDGDKDERGLVYMKCSHHQKMSWVDFQSDNWCDERGRTMMRNGIAFMWPESEAV
jgi:hypothetical protein